MKSKILVIISLFIIFTSCEDRLSEEIYSIQTPDNYYNNPEEGYAGLNSVWGTMNNSMGYTQCNLLWITEGLTDNHGGPGWARLFSTSLIELKTVDFDAANTIVTGVFQGFYKMIFRANSFIDFMSQKTWNPSEEPIRKAQIAEATLYRAIAYFYLVRLFGEIQIVTNLEGYDNITEVPKSSIEEVYTQIISDLKAAQADLPNRAEQPQGRAFEDVATGILAKVFLTMGGEPLNQTDKFQLAVTEAEKVIANESEHPLAETYYDAFSEAQQNSGEQMLAIQTEGFGGGYWYPSNKRLPFNPYCVDFVEAFEEGDDRKELTFWNYYTNDVIPYDEDTITRGQEADDILFCGKYRSDPNFVDDKPNWPILRYAEVLLIHAEAENEVNGPTTKAYNSINKVRDRALLPDLSDLTKDEFREAIKHERRIELSMEYKRWFDLVRWGDLLEKVNAKFEDRGESHRLIEKHKLYPIPETEIQRNPGMRPQNPGWE